MCRSQFAEAPTGKESWAGTNNITINWELNSMIQCSNDTEVKFVLKSVCNYDKRGEGSRGYDLKNGTIPVLVDRNNAVNATVPDLSPYTIYNCTATLESTGHAGQSLPNSPKSETVIVTTAQDGKERLSNNSALMSMDHFCQIVGKCSSFFTVPSAPVNFTRSNVTSTSVVFQWGIPTYIPGNLVQYEIDLSWKPLFPVPKRCPLNGINYSNISYEDNLNDENFTKVYDRLTPYSNYSVRIRASTAGGWGNFSESIEFTTRPDGKDVSMKTFILV